MQINRIYMGCEIKIMKYKKMLIVIIFSLILEIFFFNMTNIINSFDRTLAKNISYGIDQFEKINWKNENDILISKFDPILEINKIDFHVRNIEVKLEGNGNLPYIDTFFVSSREAMFSEDNIERFNTNISGSFKSTVKIDVNKFVSKLRLDLSDKQGLELSDITIIINPSKVEISYARLIAMWLIYLTSKLLFSLQKNPKYDEY